MIRWIVLGVMAYLVLVLVQLPASFVMTLVETPKPLQVSGVSGTIWSGKAHTLSWEKVELDQVEWQLDPLALLTGTAKLDVSAGDRRTPISLSGTVGASLEGVFAEDLVFELPASLIQDFYPLPAELKGRIKGSIQQASQGKPWCGTLKGKLTWHSPEVTIKALGQSLKLDDTQAKLSCDKGNLVADISDEGRVLGLAVNASLSAKGYLLSGEMKPGPEFPPQFKQGLNFIASPLSGGRYKIEMDGAF